MRASGCRRRGQGGSMLILAMFFVLLLAVVGVLVVRHAGRDRILSAQMVTKERAFACAEAGLQYGRRFFGMSYEASNGWNDYLNGTKPGYSYDPDPKAANSVNLGSLPPQVRGAFDGATYDPGTTYDGAAMFWVSIRDDEDEAASGQVNNPQHDNNEAVIVRSECTAFYYVEGGQDRTAVVEALLVHVQNASGYGNAQVTSNSPDILGQMGTK